MGAVKEKKDKVQDEPLKGTWISVTVVGVVILATYLLLYGFYMDRF
ncbi:cytochrome c oxidase subunit 2A [Bacillus sp. MRMR6]|nr:cytochrome c oxidase subunit 2A [Bacillus sp. MRMR6]